MIRVDISGTVETLFTKTHTIKRDDDPAQNALTVDSGNGWLVTDSVFLAPHDHSIVQANAFPKRRFQ
ncbi:MAG: hypothetical protein WDN28_17960 [Chthoniobacter sp.]